MKTKILTFITVISISAFLFTLLISFTPEDNDKGGFATVRIYENFSVVNSKIIISYGNEKNEIIDLGPFKYNDDYLIANNDIINTTLNKLKEKGYKLITSSSSGKITSNKALKVTTFIFEKD